MGVSAVRLRIAFLLASCLGGVIWAQGTDTFEVPAPAAPSPTAPVGQDAPARVYIPVGDPKLRKALLAIERVGGSGAVHKEFQETLRSNMDFVDLFEILPEDRLPSASESWDPYRALGVEFVIRSSLSTVSGRPEVELRLFDVARGLQILGRKYPFVSPSGNAGRELAHVAGNEVVRALTGEDGIFRTRILMSCGSRRKEIYIMDFDGKNIRPITRDGNFALSPSWAQDGRRILFTSYKPATRGGPLNPNLYSLDLLSNQRRLLSAARGLNTGGVFHPKENKIAYTFSQNGRPEIFVLDLNSNTRRPITRTQFFSVEPAWSPDGSRLAYSSSQTGRPHIFVANADGSGARRLTFAGVYNSSPNWSPLGDRLVFSGQENRANNFNIFRIDPSGSNLVRLTDTNWSSENPVHSPDGRFIAYSSNQKGRYQIHVMTVEGQRARALTPLELGDCKQPAWSPRL
jgi:TolB protein